MTGGNNTFTIGAGFLGGGQIGASYQWNALVLGVEGDFNWAGLKGSGSDFLGDSIGTETQWTLNRRRPRWRGLQSPADLRQGRRGFCPRPQHFH